MQPMLKQWGTLHRLALPEAAKRSWSLEASQLVFPDLQSTPHDLSAWRAFVDASVHLADRHLPLSIQDSLNRFFLGTGSDAVLLENLPVDPDLPRSPTDGKRPALKSAVSEAIIVGLTERSASIVSFSNEKAGAPIHEITPVVGLEHIPSSAGRAPFAYHTDAAFLAPRFSPRGLILFGLKNQTNAPTAVLTLDRILESAPAALVRSLRKSIFRHPAPASFELPISVTGPILWLDDRGIFRIAAQTHAVQPAAGPNFDEAYDAISQLRALLDSIEPQKAVLLPGTALLFKNDRVLHGRDAFTGERWLQRAYFTDSTEPFRQRTGAPPDEFVFDARRLLKPTLAEKTLAPQEPISHSKN